MKRKSIAGLLVGIAVVLVVAACGSTKTVTKTVTATAKAPTTTTPTSTAKVVNAASEIPLAPAFSEEELAAVPAANWLSPSGGTTGDRYSSLTQINTSNVSELKGDWMTELNGSGALTKYSQEASPVEYEGVIYIPTGADDIFAVSASSGKILWENKGNQPASTASAVCCGWDNRGVAIGNGKVYSSLLDGYVEALNQKTGELVWKTEIGSVSKGETVTMAPLYEDGMVFIGPVGAEYGVRGFMAAYSATTGKLIWKHYNIPSPSEPGGNSWPSNNNLWEHGGATTWNTPTVDPKLGLIYYSTANAGEDFEGKERPGDNLYASSILALNMKTGKMAWYYQTVHHDIWDFDDPSPTVLMNVEVNGKMEEGIAEPSKTGYVYFLNRKTGKPVFPINEEPVPQSAADATSKTQPIPTMAPFSPVKIDAEQTKILQESVKSATPAGQPVPKVIAGRLFTPWEPANGKTIESANNVAVGGDNWPPSSFDQSNSYYYVCSQSGAVASNLAIASTKKKVYKAGETFTGSNPTTAINGFDSPGFLTAYDMKTGKIVWQKSFPKESCYSGAVSTASNVVFAGRNNGELTAYNATTGEKLWAFQTGAGANAPVALYESGGEEHVVELAGGNALAGSSHGDNLWQWSLKGTKEPVAAGSSAKAIEHAGAGKKAEEARKEALEKEEAKEKAPKKTEEAPANKKEVKKEEVNKSAAVPTAASVAAGKTIFSDNCSTCHGIAGTGGNGGPNLNDEPRAKSVDGVIEQLTKPLGAMPSFKEQLSATEKEDVAAYVTEEITHAVKK